MKIYINKVGMLRPNFNPKNQKLKLNLDWSVDFKDIDQKFIKYNCILKTYENFHVNFKTEGILKLEACEKFSKEIISEKIFEKTFELLIEMIGQTRDISVDIIENEKLKINDIINTQVLNNSLMN